ncbi:MAG: hypothetical protein NC543_08055 [bacterium]|nr:hypothetical protein [bacterium]MCM1373532.1 hypothetical protein [Muribaculum sp.]
MISLKLCAKQRKDASNGDNRIYKKYVDDRNEEKDDDLKSGWRSSRKNMSLRQSI